MNSAIIMLHGFSGSPQDLEPVASFLKHQFPELRVLAPKLTGGWRQGISPFDPAAICRQIQEVYSSCRYEADRVIFLGHSTGGNLLLHFLSQAPDIEPDLIALVNSPARISLDYLERWQKHIPEDRQPSLTGISFLVSLINKTSNTHLNMPALILQGEKDELLNPAAIFTLRSIFSEAGTRAITVPCLQHHFSTTDQGTQFFLDILKRAISDLEPGNLLRIGPQINKLINGEPTIRDFISVSPVSAYHLVHSPSGSQALQTSFRHQPVVASEPVFANLEITTDCNLDCAFCARQFTSPLPGRMNRKQFNQILDLLPHAYRITLVGLGEPLLHPEITHLIKDIDRRKRHSGIVTNAMLLNRSKGADLLNSGLKSIAFSLDSATEKTLQQLRRGSNLGLIISNIRAFMDSVEPCREKISTAVFSAVSRVSVEELDKLADLVLSLGVHIWMLTDLNYCENADNSLCKAPNREQLNEMIKKVLLKTFSRGLPILTVQALEAFGLRKQYHNYLPLSAGFLFNRARTRNWCNSPWQTIAINNRGDVSICDCQPERIIGNIFRQPLSRIWNGKAMVSFRKQMLSSNPPECCLSCPRF
jgi:radical SAM protein with 4Fe4S-binding SPASM domain